MTEAITQTSTTKSSSSKEVSKVSGTDNDETHPVIKERSIKRN